MTAEAPGSSLHAIWRVTRLLLVQPELRATAASSFLLGLAASFVLPFFSLFGTREVGMSLGEFGAFMTATAVANILITTVVSHRSDALYSRRTLLLVGSAAGALGYLGYAYARDLWALLVLGGAVMGVASLTFSQLFAHARELVDRSESARPEAALYLSAIRMCFALAWTVGPALAAVLLDVFSFRGLFLCAASLYVALFVLIYRSVHVAARSGTARPPLSPMGKVLVRPAILAWFIAFALVFAAHSISLSNMALLVLNVLGGDESDIGIIFGLAPLFELPFMLYFGLLATRISTPRLIRAAMALAVVYYALLSVVHAPWHIYPLQFLSAAIVAVTSGVAISFFQDKLPGQSGAATNLYMTASRVGSTSGFLLFGAVGSAFGNRGAYVTCAGLAAAGLAVTLLLDRSGEGRAEPASLGGG